MFFRFSLVGVLCFVSLAFATPWGEPGTVTKTVTATAPGSTVTTPASSCGSGNLQCCNSMQSGGSAISGGGLSLDIILAIVAGGLNQNVGKNCHSISILGIGNCNAQTLCCSNNQFGGLISLGCIPVNIGL